MRFVLGIAKNGAKNRDIVMIKKRLEKDRAARQLELL